MTLRSAFSRLKFGKLALSLGVCALVCAPTFAQTDQKPTNPPSNLPVNQKETTLKGCLIGGLPELIISATEGNFKGQSFTLSGHMSELSKYVEQEISVQGIEDDSASPQLSFQVDKLIEVFKRPNPSLSPSFTKSSAWTKDTNQTYGIAFAVPPIFAKVEASKSGIDPNFVAQQDRVALAGFQVDRGLYPDSNFVGGAFAIFVDPAITNQPSCDQFGRSDPRFLSSTTIGGVKYAAMMEADAAMGTGYAYHYFHIFQNGLCYELAFEFAEYNTGSADDRCAVPQLENIDEQNVIEPVMSQVSFFRPATGIAASDNPNAIPSVTSFVASSQVADGALNRGQITFTWSTENADYVQFSYRCSSDSSKGIVISEDNAGGRECENLAPIINSTSISNHSANSSAGILFGNFHRENPLSIVVTITPFSHGIAHPDSRKSITIVVNPYNPFPQGLPLAPTNTTLSYAANADGSSRFAQGSTLAITWPDTLSRGPCLNLYLLQESEGKEVYRAQLADTCLKPSAGNSYSWTISNKFSGPGFRIYARAPGGTSSGYGAPFTIIQTDPSASHN
jgi:hypothetical protein